VDYSQYMGGQPQVDPVKAALFGAPPAPAVPVAVQNAMPPMAPMPQVGTPGGFGVTMFRLADMVRRYGQMARQQQGRF
jgi:hypothetical protein